MSQKRKTKYKQSCVAAKKVDSSKWLAVKDAREPKKKRIRNRVLRQKKSGLF
jgi:hypothetical protein